MFKLDKDIIFREAKIRKKSEISLLKRKIKKCPIKNLEIAVFKHHLNTEETYN
jgi:hypothetical protein